MLSDVQEMKKTPFIVQCKRCGLILADSYSCIAITNTHFVFREKTENIQCEKENSEINSTFKDCLYNNIICKCNKIVGVYLKSASREFNGFSGAYLFKTSDTRHYQLGAVSSGYRTMADIEEDIYNLKKMFEKFINNAE